MMGTASQAEAIRASDVLFIKLGAGGALEDLCISDGSLRLDYRRVPEVLARSGSHRALSDFCLSKGMTKAKPTAGIHAGIIRNFFDAKDDVLWITFANGLLYWCFASPNVTYLGPDDADSHGCFRRDSRGGWQSQSIVGQELRVSELNGELTKISAFRMAICRLSDEQTRYLLARINGDDLPQVRAAKLARTKLEETLDDLVRKLSWRDFELLVDLIFSRSGWRRISSLGGAKKTTDIDLILPTTGARAFVQVKAETDQAQLIEYAEKFKLYERSASKEADSHSFFYVYHTAKKPLRSPSAEITIWGVRDVSRLVIDSGLTDWLIQKVG
jgi:hypothetical protein